MRERGIIPRPVIERYFDGRLFWSPETDPTSDSSGSTIYYSGARRDTAAGIAAYLGRATGAAWSVAEDPAAPAFARFVLDESGPQDGPGLGMELGAEGYALRIGERGVECRARGDAGLFYGFQSLRQLLPDGSERGGGLADGFSLPFASVVDRPRFAWRGFMLDEARHFHGADTVKALLDAMALHKLNVFHWHLDDDQGWRIQVDRYPELTRIGSRRRDSAVGGVGSAETAGEPYGGFYAKEEIRDIVGYAAARFITVVPELELPGHASAALASYPSLGCSGGPYDVKIGSGIFPDIYCAGKDSTLSFLEGVLDELLELFPSRYLHLGGDEAPKTRWKACPDCQARMASEGLASEAELQVWLFNKAATYLASRGRAAIGWNEALGERLLPEAIAQYWAGGKGILARHMRRGRRVIMSDFWRAYLDYDYSLHPLRKSYCYEPVPRGFGDGAVLGMEAALWTEWVRDRRRLDWQAFPRLTAHAETAWTGAALKSYPDFERRLLAFLPRLAALGVGYAGPGEWNPPAWRRLAMNARFLWRFLAAALRRRG